MTTTDDANNNNDERKCSDLAYCDIRPQHAVHPPVRVSKFTPDGGRRTTDGGRRTADGGRRTADDDDGQ